MLFSVGKVWGCWGPLMAPAKYVTSNITNSQSPLVKVTFAQLSVSPEIRLSLLKTLLSAFINRRRIVLCKYSRIFKAFQEHAGINLSLRLSLIVAIDCTWRQRHCCDSCRTFLIDCVHSLGFWFVVHDLEGCLLHFVVVLHDLCQATSDVECALRLRVCLHISTCSETGIYACGCILQWICADIVLMLLA